MISTVRIAVRQLLSAPGFAIAVLAALALGIGANTAIFTIINTVLLHPLPYPNSERIVEVARQRGGAVSVPMFTFWLRNDTGLEDLSAHQPPALSTLAGADRPESVDSMRVSQSYFKLFGANPIVGRTFSSIEDQPGGHNVAVISYDLWMRRFLGDRFMTDKSITLDGAAFAIVGVLPSSFRPYPAADVWLPLQADPSSTDQAGILAVVARLPRGATIASAFTQMAAINEQYLRTDMRQLGTNSKLEIVTMERRLTGDVRTPLLILLGAVALVLLIACANVANLLLARTTARQKELAIRVAVGATRGQIVGQLLTESLLLSLAGGAAGLVAGSWAVRVFVAWAPASLPRIQEMATIAALDPWVAGFTLLLSLVAGVAFGLFPVMTTRLNAQPKTLFRQNRPHAVLIGAEMAITVVLLCGAVLLTRSFDALRRVELGFDAKNLLTIQTSLHGPAYTTSSGVDRVSRKIVDRLQQIPGVESATVASALPLLGQMDMIFSVPDQPLPEGRKFTGDVQWRFVSPNYFSTLKMNLVSGRFLNERESQPAVVINQSMARQFWGNADPTGRRIVIGSGLGTDFDQGETQIVGVVADERIRLNIEAAPIMYQLPAQVSDAALKLMNRLQPVAVLVRIREQVPAMSLGQTVESELVRVTGQPAANIRTMDQARSSSITQENFNRTLLALFAGIATLLAAVGVYGVISYNVVQRTTEIGVRIAIGADRSAIRSFVLRRALRISSVGAAIGIIASLGLTPLLRSQLFGIKSSDPVTFVAAPLILLIVAMIAAYVPAIRASRVDPIVVLHHE